MPPRLSIIIPVKNCLQYLPTAIESIRRQAIEDVEIVVIDDQSTDGLDRWLAEESQRDRRLKCLTGPGQGVAVARNVGLAACTAPLVGFVDADDQWNDHVIADRLELMEQKPEIVLSFADHETYSVDGRHLASDFAYWPRFSHWLDGRRGLLPLGGRAFDLIFAENVCGTGTVLARRDAMNAAGGFDPRLRICEDWDLWLKLSRQGEVCCSTTVTSRALSRPDSTSRNLPVLLTCLEIVTAEHLPYADRRTRAIARARLATVRADVAEADGRMPQAALHRLRSALHDPTRRAAREFLAAAYQTLTGRRAVSVQS
jgi:cellulose synthase/poly-beta-1,6-N-acetylglucosamine synthase-like glycosyltransferase